MKHDYAEKDWLDDDQPHEPIPWWAQAGWFVYLVLSVYALLWLATIVGE